MDPLPGENCSPLLALQLGCDAARVAADLGHHEVPALVHLRARIVAWLLFLPVLLRRRSRCRPVACSRAAARWSCRTSCACCPRRRTRSRSGCRDARCRSGPAARDRAETATATAAACPPASGSGCRCGCRTLRYRTCRRRGCRAARRTPSIRRSGCRASGRRDGRWSGRAGRIPSRGCWSRTAAASRRCDARGLEDVVEPDDIRAQDHVPRTFDRRTRRGA